MVLLVSKENRVPEYITENRVLVEAIRDVCGENGITARFFSDEWVVMLEKSGKRRLIYVNSFDLNSDASARIAADKVATYEILSNADLPAVPHFTLSTIISPSIDTRTLQALFDTYMKLVVKPLQGRHGNDIRLFSTVNDVLEFTNSRALTGWAASPYVDIARELRLIVCDDLVNIAYEKTNPTLEGALKIFNLNHGATAHTIPIQELPADIKKLAVDATKALELHIAAVDIVFDQNNTPQILEVNSSFGLEHYAATSPEHRHIAKTFYKTVIASLFV